MSACATWPNAGRISSPAAKGSASPRPPRPPPANPAILLMDEPFSALDVATRETLQDEVVRIWRETGKTVLFVTHDIDEAVYLADRVIALGGKPGEVRSSREIMLERPRRRGAFALAEIAAQV